MKTHTISFTGALLRRGFWIYVAEIQHGRAKLYYVGRTGDSSSPNAASIFTRLSRHLDSRPKARGNTLWQRVGERGIDQLAVHYRIVGIRLFDERRKSLPAHRRPRNKTAAIERAVADWLREERGVTVMGDHPRPGKVSPDVLRRIRGLLGRELFEKT